MRQMVRPGGSIDAITSEELQAMLGPPESDVGYAGIYDVIMGDFDRPEPVLLTSPPVRRLRITRTPRGGDALTIGTTLATTSQICVPNEGRMGLQIVNYGAANLFVYLAAYEDLMAGGGQTVGTLWLKSGGGSWDGEFAECLWAGSVTVRADVGTTTISLAEI